VTAYSAIEDMPEDLQLAIEEAAQLALLGDQMVILTRWGCAVAPLELAPIGSEGLVLERLTDRQRRVSIRSLDSRARAYNRRFS
jgi:hypothetical protein